MTLTTKQRQQLYDREQERARLAKRGDYPICNLCDGPVGPGQEWDESHCPSKAKAFGGTQTGIAHRRCNRDHNHRFVTPAVAKAKRLRAKHTRAKIASHRPLPCGRNSPFKRPIGSFRPVWRDSGREV